MNEARQQFLSARELPLVPQVTCDGCGACCLRMGYPPFTGMYNHAAKRGDPEWLALPVDLAAEARQGAVDGRGDAELPCVWLDLETRRCRNYDRRPSICREFEMGSEDCLRHRRRAGIDILEGTREQPT